MVSYTCSQFRRRSVVTLIWVLISPFAYVSLLSQRSGTFFGVQTVRAANISYIYDEVGNLLSISRQSTSIISIIEFTPDSGPVGTLINHRTLSPFTFLRIR
jgi:hypothetical protein